MTGTTFWYTKASDSTGSVAGTAAQFARDSARVSMPPLASASSTCGRTACDQVTPSLKAQHAIRTRLHQWSISSWLLSSSACRAGHTVSHSTSSCCAGLLMLERMLHNCAWAEEAACSAHQKRSHDHDDQRGVHAVQHARRAPEAEACEGGREDDCGHRMRRARRVADNIACLCNVCHAAQRCDYPLVSHMRYQPCLPVLIEAQIEVQMLRI